ncbi:hypothetical protein GCM10009663_75970 [Kitasatospora arboriphila]|uniref:Uncharacterized protein n=1 Tax=Kitasatospora arboriphila TaxID=258052 RepID=A0ABP4EQY7_9ACTN
MRMWGHYGGANCLVALRRTARPWSAVRVRNRDRVSVAADMISCGWVPFRVALRRRWDSVAEVAG